MIYIKILTGVDYGKHGSIIKIENKLDKLASVTQRSKSA